MRFGQAVSPHDLRADVRKCDYACFDEVPREMQFGLKMLVTLGFDRIVGEVNGAGVVALEGNGRGGIAGGGFAAADNSGNSGPDTGGNREDAEINEKTAQVDSLARSMVQADVFGVASRRGRRLLKAAGKGNNCGRGVETE